MTFDIDAVDPAFAPGTGTPEVGGLTSHEAQRLVRGLAGLSLVGGDIVEVSPPFDGPGQITALLAANIMFEFLCAMAARSRASIARDETHVVVAVVCAAVPSARLGRRRCARSAPAPRRFAIASRFPSRSIAGCRSRRRSPDLAQPARSSCA